MNSLVKHNGNQFPAIPSLLEDFFGRDWLDSSLQWSSRGSVPAVNILETGDEFVLEVAAPGMKREDFKVELDNNMLTISANRENTAQDNGRRYTRREFNYHSFTRSFSLPENKVVGDKIKARYAEGILCITVPKTENAKVKPPRQIAIA